ncbi:cytochrome b5 [Colletotrichum paranaense]|uniref:Cytochrome b5 n=1 Tax=Colletotrichum paranaense TaxID=1914294 RepID=A0ABQ9SWZ2_9PEZI|nr:cytochrome b5 [Colletotrichum paranaense]KAK1544030.1 cytochrome b5 [Colletotrichum paranaense]
MQRLGRSDLSKHHELDDLWISIRGRVYDVTKYADDHPGGIEVLKDVAGSDGTESFEYVGHSEDAYKTLKEFQIGVLVEYVSPQKRNGKAFIIANKFALQEDGNDLGAVWDAQRVKVEKPPNSKPILVFTMTAATAALFVVGKSGCWLLGNKDASYRKIGILHGVPELSAWFWLYLGMTLSTVIGMHTYFLGLSLVGYDSLWGRMIRCGAAREVGMVKQTGIFPNGDMLRTNFTGLQTFDKLLVPAVIFYNNILSNGLRSDLFNQAWGAAAVYPLYCFAHVQRFLEEEKDQPKNHEIGPSNPEEALALVPAAILGAITPAMLLFPAFTTTFSTNQRQGLIALYRFTPLALAFAHPLFIWLQGKIPGSSNFKYNQHASENFIAASLLISGATAATGHVWALACLEHGELRRTFVPATSINTASPTVIADGARDFLQWDIFIITATLVPMTDLIFRSSRSFRRFRKQYNWFRILEHSFFVRVAGLTLASGLLSPGAVLAMALAMRASEK